MLRPIACALLLSGLPAQIQAQAAQAVSEPQKVLPSKPAADPMNEKVCERITLVGSRLATKKFCGTRAEWADRKRQDREALEAAQRGPCVLTHNGGSGKPAC